MACCLCYYQSIPLAASYNALNLIRNTNKIVGSVQRRFMHATVDRIAYDCHPQLSEMLHSLSIEQPLRLQSRGFKTNRSGHGSIGLVAPSSRAMSPDVSFIRKMFESGDKQEKQRVQRLTTSANPPAVQNTLKRLVSDASIDDQQKLKVAFAEGYLSRDDTHGSRSRSFQSDEDSERNKSSATKRLLRNLIFYGFLVYCMINILSAAGFKASISTALLPQYEVLPEDVNVTFDDVKGVDEAKQELVDVVSFLK
ncbi:hypothetical protein ACOME3_007269 [Neoechinorhynchus agilis]